MGLGLARAGGLRPAALRDSAAMRAVQHQQRPPCGWANDSRLKLGDGSAAGLFLGFGGGGDGWVAPCRVVRFWGDGRQCAPRSASNVCLVDGTAPLVGDWTTGK